MLSLLSRAFCLAPEARAVGFRVSAVGFRCSGLWASGLILGRVWGGGGALNMLFDLVV